MAHSGRQGPGYHGELLPAKSAEGWMQWAVMFASHVELIDYWQVCGAVNR